MQPRAHTHMACTCAHACECGNSPTQSTRTHTRTQTWKSATTHHHSSPLITTHHHPSPLITTHHHPSSNIQRQQRQQPRSNKPATNTHHPTFKNQQAPPNNQ